jgi:hypothetical protein
MKHVAVRVVVAAVLVALTAPAAAQQPIGPKDRGFALEVHLGTRLVSLNESTGGATPLNLLDGGFFVGYKLGRLMVGGSVDFTRDSTDDGTSEAVSLLVLMPGVRITIVRSADQRVELFGLVDFGYGHLFVDRVAQPDHNRLIYQLGPGLRLWLNSSFALGAVVGLRGEFDIEEGRYGTTTGLTSLFARLVFTGVF